MPNTATPIKEIDEALRHLSLVPEQERGPAWDAYLNALLDTRSKLEKTK